MEIISFPLEPGMRSDLAVHPGELLGDELDTRGMTRADLARAIRRPVGMVNNLVNGRLGITARTALELESALGISARMWMGLQDEYELVVADAARAAVVGA